MPDYKTKGNLLYCEKHGNWFFSSKFAKTGDLPYACPICKQPKFWEERKRK